MRRLAWDILFFPHWVIYDFTWLNLNEKSSLTGIKNNSTIIFHFDSDTYSFLKSMQTRNIISLNAKQRQRLMKLIFYVHGNIYSITCMFSFHPLPPVDLYIWIICLKVTYFYVFYMEFLQANNADPVQRPRLAASEQGLHCLHTSPKRISNLESSILMSF